MTKHWVSKDPKEKKRKNDNHEPKHNEENKKSKPNENGAKPNKSDLKPERLVDSTGQLNSGFLTPYLPSFEAFQKSISNNNSILPDLSKNELFVSPSTSAVIPPNRHSVSHQNNDLFSNNCNIPGIDTFTNFDHVNQVLQPNNHQIVATINLCQENDSNAIMTAKFPEVIDVDDWRPTIDWNKINNQVNQNASVLNNSTALPVSTGYSFVQPGNSFVQPSNSFIQPANSLIQPRQVQNNNWNQHTFVNQNAPALNNSTALPVSTVSSFIHPGQVENNSSNQNTFVRPARYDTPMPTNNVNYSVPQTPQFNQWNNNYQQLNQHNNVSANNYNQGQMFSGGPVQNTNFVQPHLRHYRNISHQPKNYQSYKMPSVPKKYKNICQYIEQQKKFVKNNEINSCVQQNFTQGHQKIAGEDSYERYEELCTQRPYPSSTLPSVLPQFDKKMKTIENGLNKHHAPELRKRLTSTSLINSQDVSKPVVPYSSKEIISLLETKHPVEIKQEPPSNTSSDKNSNNFLNAYKNQSVPNFQTAMPAGYVHLSPNVPKPIAINSCIPNSEIKHRRSSTKSKINSSNNQIGYPQQVASTTMANSNNYHGNQDTSTSVVKYNNTFEIDQLNNTRCATVPPNCAYSQFDQTKQGVHSNIAKNSFYGQKKSNKSHYQSIANVHNVQQMQQMNHSNQCAPPKNNTDSEKAYFSGISGNAPNFVNPGHTTGLNSLNQNNLINSGYSNSTNNYSNPNYVTGPNNLANPGYSTGNNNFEQVPYNSFKHHAANPNYLQIKKELFSQPKEEPTQNVTSFGPSTSYGTTSEQNANCNIKQESCNIYNNNYFYNNSFQLGTTQQMNGIKTENVFPQNSQQHHNTNLKIHEIKTESGVDSNTLMLQQQGNQNYKPNNNGQINPNENSQYNVNNNHIYNQHNHKIKTEDISNSLLNNYNQPITQIPKLLENIDLTDQFSNADNQLQHMPNQQEPHQLTKQFAGNEIALVQNISGIQQNSQNAINQVMQNTNTSFVPLKDTPWKGIGHLNYLKLIQSDKNINAAIKEKLLKDCVLHYIETPEGFNDASKCIMALCMDKLNNIETQDQPNPPNQPHSQ